MVLRRGKKRALIAIGHKILIASYFILKDQVAYRDLGVAFLENKRKTNQIHHHIKRLNELGIDTEQLQVAYPKDSPKESFPKGMPSGRIDIGESL